MRTLRPSLRDQFATIIQWRDEFAGCVNAQTHNDNMHRHIIHAAQTLHPKKTGIDLAKARKLLGVDAVASIMKTHQDRFNLEWRNHSLWSNAFTWELRMRADDVEIVPGEPKLWANAVSYFSTFSTQTSPGPYAQARAEMRADVARARGVGVDVVYAHDSSSRSESRFVSGERYDVYVSVASSLDIEIIDHSTPLPMREMVRLMWKRGVNPRVIFPFLPHGYEEREGFDFSGNDLPSFRATSAP